MEDIDMMEHSPKETVVEMFALISVVGVWDPLSLGLDSLGCRNLGLCDSTRLEVPCGAPRINGKHIAAQRVLSR